MTEYYYYTIRSPWDWVLKIVSQRIKEDGVTMLQVVDSKQMPSAKIPTSSSSAPSSRTPKHLRRSYRKGPIPCTMRLDIATTSSNNDDEDNGNYDAFRHPDLEPSLSKLSLVESHHGTSQALDGLEDKDELVRTFQRCRADHLELTPPSVLIRWDITRDECRNMLLMQGLPKIQSAETTFAVLKEPMGSRGEGIYFVQSVGDIYRTVEQHRIRANNQGNDFLDDIIAQKGRIPAWVLQAEVYPPMLVRGGRKFHIRSYVAAVECLDEPHVVHLYVYNRHEVRIAGKPVDDSEDRDRLAHITNGALMKSTERILMSKVEEIASYQPGLEVFVSKTMQALMPDIVRRVRYSAQQQQQQQSVRKFALAGLDIMMTQDGRFYLLEVNVNPAAPPENTATEEFRDHLVGFMTDFIHLVIGQHATPNFVLLQDILER